VAKLTDVSGKKLENEEDHDGETAIEPTVLYKFLPDVQFAIQSRM